MDTLHKRGKGNRSIAREWTTNIKQVVTHRGYGQLDKQAIGRDKKKIDLEFDILLPDHTKPTPRQVEYYSNLKKRTKLVLRSIISGEDVAQEVQDVDDHLFGMYEVGEFSGAEGQEAKYKVGFEEICSMMMVRGIQDPRMVSVVTFYKAIDTLKHINKQRRKEAAKQQQNQSRGKRSLRRK